ncbi:MAG: histone deacetylase [Candidatus Bathyarchaeia archaeon]
MKTALIYSSKYLEHRTGDCPERAQRLTAAMSGIKRSGILSGDKVALVEPRYARIEELQMAHKREYIEMVKQTCEAGGGLIGEETPVSRESFDVARLAAGGAIKAMDKVLSGDFKNSFVLARPPGHHAEPRRSMGFCIFNNVALAAKHLIERRGMRRVLILDIDAHHGNGTQKIFYDASDVLYISIHEDPSDFPKTGFIWEVGEKDGVGYTVNIPLPYGAGDSSYWRAFKEIILPILEQYKPEFILISVGYDGYYMDTISELSLSAHIYSKIFQEVTGAAERLCSGRVAAILEGGYNLRFLRKIVAASLSIMASIDVRVRDRRPPLNLWAERMAEKIINDAKRVQSRYWSL